ncbi:signal recognition particle [Paragemmobacter ruber]|uniref:Signal recognition particle n=1 Tax=Paragemmobacter ruber TaxID=1985673 RepID=A0ABW9Y0E2_9RHOB|nr:signal recognition particle [Rhodobacter ruber]NBE05956.1 signal recognition particle [Rhodobacter ruber]
MRKLIALSLAITASPAAAMDDLQAIMLANSLGSMIASETLCGLSYDQAAISRYIATNVPPERMDFASQLQVQTMGIELQLQNLSASARTAHCAAITQSARQAGFIE